MISPYTISCHDCVIVDLNETGAQDIVQRQRASRVAYPELVDWSVTFWGPKGLIVARCDPKSDPEA